MVTASIDTKTNELVIRAKLQDPKPSSTGKMMLVSPTGWHETEAKIEGKNIKLSLNAGFKP